MTEANADKFVGAKELAELMDCSVTEARNIMHRADFPAVRIGKQNKVQLRALAEWASVKREKEN